MLAYWLLIIGGLNWGLVGIFNFNLVDWIFGDAVTLERIVYALVGIATVIVIVGCCCKKCKACCPDGTCGSCAAGKDACKGHKDACKGHKDACTSDKENMM